MSRVDSVKIAERKAQSPVKGCAVASDAFFPFPDGPSVALAAGVQAIIQPGGAKRDAETRAVVEQHGAAMVVTGRRHFSH